MEDFLGEVNLANLTKYGMDNFTSEAFVDLVIDREHFCEHGSDLSECEELFELFEEEYPNAATDKAQLKALLLKWMPLRVNYIVKDIIGELAYSQMIYRAVAFKSNHLGMVNDNLEKISVSKLGVYWSSRPCTNRQQLIKDEATSIYIDVRLKTLFAKDAIDWHGTFLSRIDYIHGDTEQEFKLKPSAEIKLLEVS